MPAPISKYGVRFAPDTDPLEIEMEMIRRGGQWQLPDGRTAGLGMFHHFKATQSLLWPEDDHHRWSDLILKEYLANRLIAVCGSRDSGKTRGISKAALVDYFIYPDDTLILMTSTTLRGLELRVWGDVKSLHDRALNRYPWLSGNVVDSKHGVFTDKIEEGQDVRDQRKGILCFLEGSMVDTPNGSAPIESLEVGDVVFNAAGTGRITEIHQRISFELVRVVLSDGRSLACTPEHPIFTNRGWISAVDLRTCDVVYSVHETLSLLQQSSRPRLSQPDVLLEILSTAWTGKKVQAMQETFPSASQKVFENWSCRNLLQHQMLKSLDCEATRANSSRGQKLRDMWSFVAQRALQSKVLFRDVSRLCADAKMLGVRRKFSVASAVSHAASDEVLQRILQMEIHKSDNRSEIADPDA